MTTFIYEIKIRFFYILILIFLIITILLRYFNEIIYILSKPLHTFEITLPFISSHLTDLFFLKLKLIMFLTTVLTIFYLLYQLYCFILPGLYFSEYRLFNYLLIIIFINIVLNLYATHHYIIPTAFNFFLNFQENYSLGLNIIFQPNIKNYYNFIINILIYNLIMLQFPIIFFYTLHKNYISLNFFKTNRNIFLLIIFFFGSLLSPPDIFNQLILSFIFFIFYEISIASYYIHKYYKN